METNCNWAVIITGFLAVFGTVVVVLMVAALIDDFFGISTRWRDCQERRK